MGRLGGFPWAEPLNAVGPPSEATTGETNAVQIEQRRAGIQYKLDPQGTPEEFWVRES